MGDDGERVRSGREEAAETGDQTPAAKRRKRRRPREGGERSERVDARPAVVVAPSPRRQAAQLLALLAVVGVGAWLWFEYGSVDARKRRYIASAQPMSASELAGAYKANAVAAHRRYKGDVVKVSGAVSRLGCGWSLCLAAGIECTAPGEEARLYRDGQHATVVGTVDDWPPSSGPSMPMRLRRSRYRCGSRD